MKRLKINIEDIELNTSEGICFCGKKIYKDEPCGILATGTVICMHCAKENLRENNYNTKVLLEKLNKLYNDNLNKIVANRL